MKILFLQKVDNAHGGVVNVNLKLMAYFLQSGHQVELLSFRHGDTWEKINYPEQVKQHLVNEKDIWGCPRLRDFLVYIKQRNLKKGISLLMERRKYKKRMTEDYIRGKCLIEEIQPDVIINSHYELLDGISEKFLKNTIMHFHTSFDQVIKNRSYMEMFNKYASRIHKFVWLSKKTCEEAVVHGLDNSVYIYNPLSFSASKQANMEQKKMIFLGRISAEKRVYLAIQFIKELINEGKFQGWTFEIYGDGYLREEMLELIQGEEQIIYKGITSNVKEVLLESSLMILTSEFEGMPLVVLEANECGVPVIAYDFGESSKEVILNGQTGVIVPQNDTVMFKQELIRLLENDMYRKDMGHHAKEFAKKFAMAPIGEKWMELFQEIVEN